MVNFGPRDTVPDKFANRLFYQHNPTAARQALFDAIRQADVDVELVELEHHINETQFAEAAAADSGIAARSKKRLYCLRVYEAKIDLLRADGKRCQPWRRRFSAKCFGIAT
jgi:hypothetical protein